MRSPLVFTRTSCRDRLIEEANSNPGGSPAGVFLFALPFCEAGMSACPDTVVADIGMPCGIFLARKAEETTTWPNGDTVEWNWNSRRLRYTFRTADFWRTGFDQSRLSVSKSQTLDGDGGRIPLLRATEGLIIQSGFFARRWTASRVCSQRLFAIPAKQMSLWPPGPELEP